ncbi:WD40/YVTN/BNR-like repeat-containing protein [Ramlibacter sp. MMS24-I3-19]|uniref:WD40/YVTN/BNR-like repeat-containing protein n=1 Tax=Ramlibacter sp. MMS24-I3-19 TaxID=3416606 RepID=UPI003CFEF2BD
MKLVTDTQLAVNQSYDVTATTATPLKLTLPATATANDTISIKGTGTTQWSVAQAAGQSILTSNLAGNKAPGAVWTAPATADLAAHTWHWISSDVSGQTLLAGAAINGLLYTSTDGGVTFTTGNSTPGTWISSDMSANAERMVAVKYQGDGMFTSVDKGATWTAVTSPLFAGANLSFESVTISADGQHIVAVSQGGNLTYSNDAGANFSVGTLPGATQTFNWRSVDNSADGSVIVAVTEDSHVFLSTDSGAHFSEISVAVGTPAAPVFENWYRVKMSADGQTIAVVANQFGGGSGTGIYVSHDRGATWTKGFSLTADYSALAMSADGTRIAATVSNANNSTSGAAATGEVVMSTDGGATFTPVTMPGTDTDWRAVAMSADGNKMAAATGRFTGPTAGLLYTSQGNRTSIGTAGSITGGQGANVSLKYLSNNVWSVTSSSGGPFSIK